MASKTFTIRNILSYVGFCLSWFAIIGQLVLIILSQKSDVLETIIMFFSYFTALTNILVALYFTAQIFKFRVLEFLRKETALTAITAFIGLVGLVYQLTLRSTWQPIGFQIIIDELLHSVIPLYVLFYWGLYVKISGFNLRNLLIWLIYPFTYFMIVMIKGNFSSYYPYPFIDVLSIGYLKVLTNFMILNLFVFMLIGSLYLLANVFKKHDVR